MAKSLDLRRKELIDSSTKFSLLEAWNNAVSKQKDLVSADYKKLGDVAGPAKKYDEFQDKFREADQKKKDLLKVADQAHTQVEKFSKTADDLQKELSDVADDAHESSDLSDVKSIDDVISNLEEAMKAQQDANKERKTIYENMIKNQDAYLKFLTDLHSKLKKESAAADSSMKNINDQMNRTEDQIRGTIVKYSNKATADKKPEIAAAARSVVTMFSA